MSAPIRITQSILGNADKCMLSAQYTLDPPAGAPKVVNATNAVGTAYHAGLESLYRSLMADPSATPDLGEMVSAAWAAFDRQLEVDHYDGRPVDRFNWSDKVPDLDTARAIIADLVRAYVEGGHWWGEGYQVLAVEINETLSPPEIAPHTAKLGVDVVVLDVAHNVLILDDQKTSGKAWDHNKHDARRNDQASLYTALARLHWPEHAERIRFAFSIMQYGNTKRGPLFDRRWSDPTPEHGTAVLRKARDFIKVYGITRVAGIDLPANTASHLCSPTWCEFWDVCPHGAALDTDTSLSALVLSLPAEVEPDPFARTCETDTVEPADPFEGLVEAAPAPAPRRTFDPAPARAKRVDLDADGMAHATIVAQFQERWARLDDASVSWIKALAEAAHAADRSFSVKALPSIRRLAIGRALVAMAETKHDTNEVLAALLVVVLGGLPTPPAPLGATVGALTIDQAHRLAELAAALGTSLIARFDLDGQVILTGPALAAAS